jgi:hypothetical protein
MGSLVWMDWNVTYKNGADMWYGDFLNTDRKAHDFF